MKKNQILALCAMVAMMLVSCSQKIGDPQPAGITAAQVDSVSYAIGQQLGMNIAMSSFGELNYTQIQKGILDVVSLSADELKEKSNEIQEASYDVLNSFMEARLSALAAENLAKEEAFFAENANVEGVVTTDSGLQYKVERQGNGVKPTAESTVTVNYEGTLLDGTVFDSSYEREEPVSFNLNQVIEGWAEGIQYIDEGGEITLWIPAKLAYGEHGAGNIIGPNATLKFKVELVSVEAEEEVAE